MFFFLKHDVHKAITIYYSSTEILLK